MDYQLLEQKGPSEEKVQDKRKQIDTVPSEAFLMTAPANLFSFGNTTGPRGARPVQDFDVESPEDEVGPESPPLPKGASNMTNVAMSPLTGHFHKLSAGKSLVSGLGVVADGSDVVARSPHIKGHHTIFPTKKMKVSEFNTLYKSLEWEYGGKKK